MADAELWLEIFNAIGCDKLERHDTGYYPILEGEDWGTDAPILTDSAYDLITMHAIRWLGDRGWRTLFIESNRIKCGYAPDGGICDLSITGPVAQTLCEAIKRQLEREDNEMSTL